MSVVTEFRCSLSALDLDKSRQILEDVRASNKISMLQKLRLEIEYFVATAQFQYAAMLVIRVLKGSSRRLPFSFACLILRCLYFAGKYHEARDFVDSCVRSSFYPENEIVVLFSIMVEFDDESVISFLNQFHPSPSATEFSSDRPIFFGSTIEYKKPPRKKYVFVGGTPRSGTSALGVFLNCHSELAMTVERYGYVQGFHPAMFEPNLHTKKLNGEAKASFISKSLKAKLVGDKRPNFLFGWFLTKMYINPEELKIIHLTRNPYLVAESYNKRALNQANGSGTWGSLPYSPRDKVYAVRDININNKYIEEIKENSKYSSSLLVADSSTIYSSEKKLLEVIEWLGLEITRDVVQKAKSVVEVSQGYKLKENFSRESFEYVNKNLDWCSYDRVLGLRDL